MGILTDNQVEKLLENGRRQQQADEGGERYPLIPQALLRLPKTPPAAWLLASLNPNDPDLAFGLMTLDGGPPELGFVRLSELETLRGYRDRGVYQDEMFVKARQEDIMHHYRMSKIARQIVLTFNAGA